jgi:hypothetical protein
MNRAIANVLKTKLQGLPLIDKMAGLVQTVEYQQTESDDTGTVQKTIIKKVPVSTDVELTDECIETGDLVPDSSKRGILYFEDGGVMPLASPASYQAYRSKLRLVSWFNTAVVGVDNSFEVAPMLIALILKKLCELNQTNQGNYLRLKVALESIPKSNKDIFSPYTYDIYTNGFLFAPYDYFALDLTVEFMINPDCLSELLMVSPNECL